MKAVQNITMYPLHLEEHWRFTTFPALRMPLLTQFQLHHAVPDNLASDLYAGGWNTAPLMIMIPHKMKFLCLAAHHKYSTLHLTQDHHLPSTPLSLINTWKKKQMKKRISKPSPWMMNIGLLKRFLTDHYANMNIHCHMDCALTHAHIKNIVV